MVRGNAKIGRATVIVEVNLFTLNHNVKRVDLFRKRYTIIRILGCIVPIITQVQAVAIGAFVKL
jgi:hypothetical protein